MFRKIALVTALTVSLSGCGIVSFQDANHMDHGNMHSGDSNYSADDLMFAQMMIPHHQQAVDMGVLAETRASNPGVLGIAVKIKDEQEPEILLMKSWLKEAGQSETGMHDMGMDMGMLSEQEFNDLKSANGSEFDVLYLQGMIQHHQGAIEMAKTVSDSKNEAVRNLAESIIESQTAQIEQLEQLLAEIN
jgi:uncharacterized protein (DUF305 family)